MDEGVEDRREVEGRRAEVRRKSAEVGECASRRAVGWGYDEAGRFVSFPVNSEGRRMHLPSADQIQRGEDESGGHCCRSCNEQRGPGVGRCDVDQPVEIVLDAQIWHVEECAQQAPRPVFEQ